MRILLTRAKADAERTAARLAGLGHVAVVSPVVEIIATGATLPSGRFDAVIATSAHAFAGGAASLGETPLYAVGERTRQAAQRMGWAAPIRVAENAQGLVADLRATGLRRLLYLAGRDRKGDIEAAAQDIGLYLEIVEAYVARGIAALSQEAERALRAGELDAVLHYSRRSAELVIRAAQGAELWSQATKLQHFALSPDVAEPLLAAGAQTHVAAHPNEDHLLALLRPAART